MAGQSKRVRGLDAQSKGQHTQPQGGTARVLLPLPVRSHKSSVTILNVAEKSGFFFLGIKRVVDGCGGVVCCCCFQIGF